MYIPQETESVKPIQFKDLTEEVRNQVLAETFVLFPHDLIKRYPSGTFRGEYGRSTEYLLGEYFTSHLLCAIHTLLVEALNIIQLFFLKLLRNCYP